MAVISDSSSRGEQQQWNLKYKQRCVFKHHAMKAHIGSGGNSPYILNDGARWWYVVSCTLRPKYACGTTVPIAQQAAKFSHGCTNSSIPPYVFMP